MRGTNFEFRYRFWLILLAFFFFAFGSYAIEPIGSVRWLLRHFGASLGTIPRVTAAHAIFGMAAIFMGLAAWIRTWGTAYLNKDVVQDSAIHGDRLVADGPYRYVRNPLYFGTILAAVAFAPLAPPIGAILLVAGMGILVLRLIGCEESFLAEQQGEPYRAYLARVRRLRPSLRPRLPSCGAQPRWSQAMAGELWMWMFFGGEVIFALTFSARLFDAFVWGGLGLYFIFRMAARRRAERRPA